MQLKTNLAVHDIAQRRYWLTHAAHTSLSGRVSSQMMETSCGATVHSGLETTLWLDPLHVLGVNVCMWHTLKYDCGKRPFQRDQKRLQVTIRKNGWSWREWGRSYNGQGEMDPQISQITFPCIQKVRLHTDNSCQRGTHPKCKHRWSGIITRTAGWGAGGNEMVYDGSAHPLMPAPNVPSSPRDVLCEKQEKMIWFAQAVRHPGRSRNVRGMHIANGRRVWSSSFGVCAPR